MKKIFLSLLVIVALQATAQKKVANTESFRVEGQVKEAKTFSLQDIAAMPAIDKDSLVITNHLLEKKGTIYHIKGVLLKDVLNKLVIDQDNPKLLSGYYIVCIASDDYKVVFSWNEIFNNPTGEQVLIITEQEGKQAATAENHIALITLNDKATGRRYVKGLQKIVIERVQ